MGSTAPCRVENGLSDGPGSGVLASDRTAGIFCTGTYQYELPRRLIAQHPLENRDQSRLMVLRKADGEMEHVRFFQIGDYLEEGDLLVVNNSRVFPARILGSKPSGGRVELMLIRPASFSNNPKSAADPVNLEAGEWLCLTRCSGRLRKGQVLSFQDGVQAEVIDGSRAEGDLWKVRFNREGPGLLAWFEEVGLVPLPPYIKRGQPDDPAGDLSSDRVNYQTLFAKTAGSVAAPTAGFHFTQGLCQELENSGIRFCEITLHVGQATFLPIRTDDLRRHTLWPERFSVCEETAEAIREARREGRRIVAVGTTVVRCLESIAGDGGEIRPKEGWASLFILPGHRFRVVDALITNFHLPQSSLLVLVSAFSGLDRILGAYREAVRREYRFYSYGDCMLIQ